MGRMEDYDLTMMARLPGTLTTRVDLTRQEVEDKNNERLCRRYIYEWSLSSDKIPMVDSDRCLFKLVLRWLRLMLIL